jgi:hypothetical protein
MPVELVLPLPSPAPPDTIHQTDRVREDTWENSTTVRANALN